mmetsp:Transcript_105696/g.340738  ORF Transcript_105696/g.340738 Transcript_105696/m.340738 type:complete len:483 (-) Transcript_105696:16-1464(-)
MLNNHRVRMLLLGELGEEKVLQQLADILEGRRLILGQHAAQHNGGAAMPHDTAQERHRHLPGNDHGTQLGGLREHGLEESIRAILLPSEQQGTNTQGRQHRRNRGRAQVHDQACELHQQSIRSLVADALCDVRIRREPAVEHIAAAAVGAALLTTVVVRLGPRQCSIHGFRSRASCAGNLSSLDPVLQMRSQDMEGELVLGPLDPLRTSLSPGRAGDGVRTEDRCGGGAPLRPIHGRRGVLVLFAVRPQHLQRRPRAAPRQGRAQPEVPGVQPGAERRDRRGEALVQGLGGAASRGRSGEALKERLPINKCTALDLPPVGPRQRHHALEQLQRLPGAQLPAGPRAREVGGEARALQKGSRLKVVTQGLLAQWRDAQRARVHELQLTFTSNPGTVSLSNSKMSEHAVEQRCSSREACELQPPGSPRPAQDRGQQLGMGGVLGKLHRHLLAVADADEQSLVFFAKARRHPSEFGWRWTHWDAQP